MSTLPKTWPYRLKSGNNSTISLPIYRVPNGEYVEYRLAWYDTDRKRKLKSFADFHDAKTFGESVLAKIGNGEIAALTLTNEDRLIYLRACEAVRPLGLSLDTAAQDYAAAVKALDGKPLQEAVKYYLRMHVQTNGGPPKSVADVVALLVEEKRKRKKSGRYVDDLEDRLTRFAEAFKCNITDIRHEDVDGFLDSLKVGERTRYNFARILGTLFGFARDKKYAPKDFDPMEGVDTAFEDTEEIEIFTPEEIGKLLKAAGPKILPFLAIGAFAGLRHAEIKRLDWSEIGEEYIEVKAAKAKTRSRRIVPVQPNLAAWLAGCREKSGPVVTFQNVFFQTERVCRDAGVDWKHNAPRHSFISYRLATVKNENQVAMEAGNTPKQIFQSYRELVSEKLGEEWFKVFPV